MSATHLLLAGVSFGHATACFHISERTLHLWIGRYNHSGIDGLTYKPGGRQPRRLPNAETGERIIPYALYPAKAGQIHWTAAILCGWLRKGTNPDLGCWTLVRYLHEKGFVRRLPGPFLSRPTATSGRNSGKCLRMNSSA